MTLVTAWYERDPSTDREVRRGMVLCAECMAGPWDVALQEKRHGIGTSEFFRARGWRFDHFETAPHTCPICAKHRHRRRWRFPATRPVNQPALPNLVVIGAQKSGTTALHRYLTMHPEIHMSEPKELNFFWYPKCLDLLETYSSYFDAEAPVRGESCPNYTFYPIASGVAERIRAAIPHTRLIYLVRDPVERSISSYADYYSQHSAPWSPEMWLGDMESPHNQYVAPSRYATQIEQYLKVFPPEQLLVIDQADLRESRLATLRKVFRFLGVDEGFVAPGFEQLVATRATLRRKTRVGGLLRESPLAEVVRMLPHGPREAVFGPARRMLSTGVDSPPVDEGLRERLRNTFRDEAARLREITGQKFATWQI